MKEERKPEYPEKTPDDELQTIPHIKARTFKSQVSIHPQCLGGPVVKCPPPEEQTGESAPALPDRVIPQSSLILDRLVGPSG